MKKLGNLEELQKSFDFNIDWNVKRWPKKLLHILREYKRVILLTKKPDVDEISQISKVTALGMLIMGFIGFLLQMAFQIFV